MESGKIKGMTKVTVRVKLKMVNIVREIKGRDAISHNQIFSIY